MHSAFKEIVDLKTHFGSIIPVPRKWVVPGNKLFPFYKLMMLDIFLYPEDAKKKATKTYPWIDDFHHYDVKQLLAEDHLSGNIPTFVVVIGTAIMFYFSLENHIQKELIEKRNEWKKKKHRPFSVDIGKFSIEMDKHLIRHYCSKAKSKFQLNNAPKPEILTRDMALTSGGEFEDVVRHKNFKKGYLKDPEECCYLTDFQMKFYFIKWSHEMVGTKSHPEKYQLFTIFELAKYVFDRFGNENPPKKSGVDTFDGNPLVSLDAHFFKLVKYFSDAKNLREYLRTPYNSLKKIGGRTSFSEESISEVYQILGLESTEKMRSQQLCSISVQVSKLDKQHFEKNVMMRRIYSDNFDHESKKRTHELDRSYVTDSTKACMDLGTQMLEKGIKLLFAAKCSQMIQHDVRSKFLHLLDYVGTDPVFDNMAGKLATSLYNKFDSVKFEEVIAKEYEAASVGKVFNDDGKLHKKGGISLSERQLHIKVMRKLVENEEISDELQKILRNISQDTLTNKIRWYDAGDRHTMVSKAPENFEAEDYASENEDEYDYEGSIPAEGSSDSSASDRSASERNGSDKIDPPSVDIRSKKRSSTVSKSTGSLFDSELTWSQKKNESSQSEDKVSSKANKLVPTVTVPPVTNRATSPHVQTARRSLLKARVDTVSADEPAPKKSSDEASGSVPDESEESDDETKDSESNDENEDRPNDDVAEDEDQPNDDGVDDDTSENEGGDESTKVLLEQSHPPVTKDDTMPASKNDDSDNLSFTEGNVNVTNRDERRKRLYDYIKEKAKSGVVVTHTELTANKRRKTVVTGVPPKVDGRPPVKPRNDRTPANDSSVADHSLNNAPIPRKKRERKQTDLYGSPQVLESPDRQIMALKTKGKRKK
jgi:hypothetical protein